MKIIKTSAKNLKIGDRVYDINPKLLQKSILFTVININNDIKTMSLITEDSELAISVGYSKLKDDSFNFHISDINDWYKIDE